MILQAAVLVGGIVMALRTGSAAWLWLCLCAVFLPAAAMALFVFAVGWWEDRRDHRTLRADSVRTYAVAVDGHTRIHRVETR